MRDHTPELVQSQLPFEEWRDVPGYEDLYQVSNWGQVKRLERRIATKRGHTQIYLGAIKKLGIKNGYYYLWLFKNSEGQKYYVHELVALAFIGPRPHNCQVHHLNENRLDNRPDNLKYMDRGEHSAYHNQGEKSSAAKITEGDVRQIRQLSKTMPAHAISKHLNLSYSIVLQVLHKQTWKHVT